MLAVYLFIALWVVIGLGLFFIAVRGRASGVQAEVRPPAVGARRAAGLTYLVIFVAFGVALPLLFLTGNHANANKQVGGLNLTATEKKGRELFGQSCGVCHTLAAANAGGTVGPDLDEVLPGQPEAEIEESIVDPEAKVAQGYPPGVMPQEFGEKLSEEELKELVKYLSESAGKKSGE